MGENDIVTRLRQQANEQEDERIIRAGREPWALDRRAADEIERLVLELGKVRGANTSLRAFVDSVYIQMAATREAQRYKDFPDCEEFDK